MRQRKYTNELRYKGQLSQVNNLLRRETESNLKKASEVDRLQKELDLIKPLRKVTI